MHIPSSAFYYLSNDQKFIINEKVKYEKTEKNYLKKLKIFLDVETF